jgi:hypothetical protein
MNHAAEKEFAVIALHIIFAAGNYRRVFFRKKLKKRTIDHLSILRVLL